MVRSEVDRVRCGKRSALLPPGDRKFRANVGAGPAEEDGLAQLSLKAG